MVKKITFNGRSIQAANITALQRHGERNPIKGIEYQHLVGLTKKGKRKSLQLGKELPKNMKLKLFYSPTKRTNQTAHYLHKGHVLAGGTTAKYKRTRKTGIREELLVKGGNNIFLDDEFIAQEIKYAGNDWNIITNKWIMGRYPSDKVIPAKKIGQDIIRGRIALGKRATKMGRKGWLILSVTHDTQIMAVLSELIAENPFLLGYTLPKVNESLFVYHTKGNNKGEGPKDILEYQGQKTDVTKKLREIMLKKKTSKP